jgi:hypothetical protein
VAGGDCTALGGCAVPQVILDGYLYTMGLYVSVVKDSGSKCVPEGDWEALC